MNRQILFLVWRYISFHWGKSTILLASLTLTILMPTCLAHLTRVFEQSIRERAVTSPLLLGVKGSDYDLTMHGLYFRSGIQDHFAVKAWHDLLNKNRGVSAPITSHFTAQSQPIVGTSLEYFEARNLRLSQGKMFRHLGQCVLGAKAASQLGATPGTSIMSDPENVFHLAGAYPLKMQVAGILERNHTPDDEAVFVDLKTHWILEGLGHGHEDVTALDKSNGKILDRTEKTVTASSAIIPYLEINESNQDSFHFHAEQETLPITAVLIWPKDTKSATLLLGEYNTASGELQLIKPIDVVESMLKWVFRVKAFMDANFVLVGLSVGGMAAMILLLSLRLRKEEFQTFNCLGCSRTLILRLVLIEWGLFLVVAWILSWMITLAIERLIQYALLGG